MQLLFEMTYQNRRDYRDCCKHNINTAIGSYATKIRTFEGSEFLLTLESYKKPITTFDL